MRLHKRNILISATLIGFAVASSAIMVSSCSLINNNKPEGNDQTNKPEGNDQVINHTYDFVSLDPSLTGNLATLGFKPTLQSLYNEATGQPSYVKALNVPVETGKQPSKSNVEMWINRDPKGMYGHAYQKNSVAACGIKNYIYQSPVISKNPLKGLEGKVDNSALHRAQMWDFNGEILDLATNLNSIVVQKNQTTVFGNKTVKEVTDAIANKVADKLNTFKTELGATTANKTISFWGASYGPNWVKDLTKFNEYGPSVYYPSWIFDLAESSKNSLGLTPAVPSVADYKLKIAPVDGYNSIGWFPNTGTYDAVAVQKAFAKSSDYVVVAISQSLNNPQNIASIKKEFSSMLKPGANNSVNENNIIIVDGSEFSLEDYDLLGVEHTMNVLAKNMLLDIQSQKVIAKTIFDTNNLTTITTNDFTFKQN